MTAREALQLSITHNLGSERNTLVPGVVVPAYTAGADPDSWAARVRAIGLSRLQPVGSAGSAFTTVRDPVAPMWTGPGGDTQVVRRDPQAQEKAIQTVLAAIAPGAGGGTTGSFSGGRWIFGDSIGGMSAAVVGAQNAEKNRELQWANLRSQEAQANANRNLAVQQMEMNRADRADRLAQIERAWKATTDVNERNRLQQEFDNELKLAEMKVGQGETANQLQAATAQKAAVKGVGDSIRAYNATAQTLVAEHNKANPYAQIRIDFDSSGTAKLVPTQQTSADAINTLNQKIAESPAGVSLANSHQALLDAEASTQLAPLQATNVVLPKPPRFSNLPSMATAALSPSQAAAARSGARPLLVPGFTAAPPMARPASTVAPAPSVIDQIPPAPIDYGAALDALLLPDAAQEFAAAFGAPDSVAAAVAPTAPVRSAAVVPQKGKVPKVTTQAAFDALPALAYYEGKNGRIYQKPAKPPQP